MRYFLKLKSTIKKLVLSIPIAIHPMKKTPQVSCKKLDPTFFRQEETYFLEGLPAVIGL